MLAFAASILLALPQFELVVWMIIGVGIGASRFTFRPLIIGAAQNQDHTVTRCPA
jgi:hypothetical protein